MTKFATVTRISVRHMTKTAARKGTSDIVG
jgi:hypothetical protein